MQLVTEEKLLVPGTEGFPNLTTHPVWEISNDRIRTIMLEDVCFCGVTHQEQPFWLGITILAGLGGVLMGLDNRREAMQWFLAGAVVALIGWALYLRSRKQLFTINSAGGKIDRELHGKGITRAAEYIDALIAAKNDRYLATRVSQRSASAT